MTVAVHLGEYAAVALPDYSAAIQFPKLGAAVPLLVN